ncbi:MAG TPA: XRE family transcriptional regulator, partial [Polyangiaceae bacterium]|nr:XRE family transcriptional regulator [Polyangiaceae bacterium]
RTARKLSQIDVAERAGLSRVGYRNVEDGEGEPKAATVNAIARALDVPVEQLLVPVRPLKRVRFRAQRKLHSREEVLATVARQLDHYEQLEELLGEKNRPAFAKVRKGIGGLKGEARALEAARRAREAFGLREQDSIRDICGLLEDHGVKVLTPAVATDGFFGLSVGDEDGGPAVAVNTWDRISVERWIFTAAHELGHLLLHLDAYDVRKTDENDNEEKEADVFASHFLVPESAFKKELEEAWGLSWYDRIFKLKRIFRVSYRSVLYRVASQLPQEQRRNIWIQFNAEYKRKNAGRSLPGTVEPDGLPPDAFFRRPAERGAEEPERLDRHDFMQDRLARLVRRALEGDSITLGKAGEMLDLEMDEMRELANSWVE